jgi:hypothetical protein
MLKISSITNQPFKNKIIILPVPEIYKHTNQSSAAMSRKIIFGKNKIWIREMPEYQIFYELSHEIGHTLKPNLENRSLDAEEVKATLFQYCFVKAVKKLKLDIPDFEKFVDFRINHINRTNPKYYEYHSVAKNIAINCNYNFDAGVETILKRLKLLGQ